LCDRDLFVELPVNGFPPAPAEAAAPPPAVNFPRFAPFLVLDVQATLGMNMGAKPGTINTAATVIKQAQPNSPTETNLEGVCPCQEDKSEQLAAILDTHLRQVDPLFRSGCGCAARGGQSD